MAKGHLLLSLEIYNRLIDTKNKDMLPLEQWCKRGKLKYVDYSKYNNHNVKMYMNHPDFQAADPHNDTYEDQYILDVKKDTDGMKIISLRYWSGTTYDCVKTYDAN